MAASTSLARRASLAVVLMIGFYLLGLIIASGLLLIPYGIYSAFGRFNVQLTFFASLQQQRFCGHSFHV